MIPVAELETLKAFESNGHLVLSVYLCLDEQHGSGNSTTDYIHQIRAQIQDCDPQPDCWEAIKEDLEIVSLYLKANGHRQHRGLAIFSCAAKYFWRAYPLPVPVSVRARAGKRFDLEPLLALQEQGEPLKL